MQALIPRQAVLTLQPGMSAGAHSHADSTNPSQLGRSAGIHSMAGSSIPPSQERVQVLIPRQAVLTLQLGRSVGSAGVFSQAGSISPQSGRSAGTHSQAGSANPPAWKQWRCSFSDRQH